MRSFAKLKPARFALLVLIGLLPACISLNDPNREPMPVKPASGGDWAAILARTPAITDFRVIDTGEVRVPLSGPLNLAHPKMSGQQDKDVYVHVYAYRFCHRTHGCYLVDSGLDDSFRAGGTGTLSGLVVKDYIRSSRQSAGQDIAAQLKTLRGPLRGVFLTHLHADHTAGVPALPAGLEYYAGADEQYINYYLLYYGGHLDAVSKITEIDPKTGSALVPFASAVDVFGDGSFWALSTPGHSRAHLSFLAITDTGAYLMTGDASHTWQGFAEGIEPGWTVNQAQMIDSLTRLRRFSELYPKVKIACGHELSPALAAEIAGQAP